MIKTYPPNTNEWKLAKTKTNCNPAHYNLSCLATRRKIMTRMCLKKSFKRLPRNRTWRSGSACWRCFKWVLHCHCSKLPFSSPVFKIKSDEFAMKLNHNCFKTTDGWLPHWKCRKQMKFDKAHGEKVLCWKSWKLENWYITQMFQ